ncbi:MAG: META domain-containing protein [Paracoccaceae bacterium]
MTLDPKFFRATPIAAFLVLLLGGCQSKDPAPYEAATGPVWIMQTLDGKPFSAETTLRFSQDGRVSGKAPCNRYFGAVKFAGTDVTIGPLGSTRMACEALDEETRYLLALAAMTELKLSRDQLILRDASGRDLTFKKQD